jgi:hypothetical protein
MPPANILLVPMWVIEAIDIFFRGRKKNGIPFSVCLSRSTAIYAILLCVYQMTAIAV